jgi:hypothetical protein
LLRQYDSGPILVVFRHANERRGDIPCRNTLRKHPALSRLGDQENVIILFHAGGLGAIKVLVTPRANRSSN